MENKIVNLPLHVLSHLLGEGEITENGTTQDSIKVQVSQADVPTQCYAVKTLKMYLENQSAFLVQTQLPFIWQQICYRFCVYL